MKGLEKALATVEEAVFLVDPATRRVLGCNAVVEEMFGYSCEELVGRTTECLHVDRAAYEEFERWSGPILEREGVFQGHYELCRRNGQRFPTAHTITPLEEEAGLAGGVISVVRDLSELRTALEALERSELRYSRLVERAPMPLLVHEFDTVVYANPAMARLLEVSDPAWLRGRPVTEIVHPDDRDEVVRRMERLRAGEAELELSEMRLLCSQGQTRPVEVTAIPIWDRARAAALTLMRDLTPERRARQELAESERYFRALIENAQDIITVIDARGIVRYESPSVEEHLGYAQDELVGEDVFELVHPEDRARARRLYVEGIRDPGRRTSVELRFRHKQGEWRVFEGLATNLANDPAVGGVVVNSRDVTEQRRVEAELAESRRRLAEAEKMEALGRMASRIAHDFSNWVFAVSAQVERLAEKSDSSELEPHIEQIRQAAERAGALSRDLLSFSRSEAAPPGILDLDSALSELRPTVEALVPNAVELRWEVESGLGRVSIPKDRLEQLLLNLVINSAHAVEGAGTITVAARRVAEGDEDARSYPRGTRLTVSDTGPGMEAGTVERIFEPFYTTKNRGTGLGLAIVYASVRAAGGTIRVDSEPGRGTTFVIWLPSSVSD